MNLNLPLVCQEFCPQGGGGACEAGGHAWWRVCMTTGEPCMAGGMRDVGMHGRGWGRMLVMHGGGSCMMGGHVAREGAYMVGGMHGRGVVYGGGHVWQGRGHIW